jgi:hypothetical protein
MGIGRTFLHLRRQRKAQVANVALRAEIDAAYGRKAEEANLSRLSVELHNARVAEYQARGVQYVSYDDVATAVNSAKFGNVDERFSVVKRDLFFVLGGAVCATAAGVWSAFLPSGG